MESEAKVSQIVEHLFRQEAGRMISALTGSFGLRNLELIEDAVQEALLKALPLWSFSGVPPNPAGWLMQVAKNGAIDHLRRAARWRESEKAIALEQSLFNPTDSAQHFTEDEIRDDQLRMMFACCHPALAAEAQVASTLKILCGFSVGEIAHAFLASTETIAKRLTRARQKLQSDFVAFEIPSGAELSARVGSVLDVLYLLFNEGYNASHGEDLIRRDLCDEAIRLTTLLSEHPAADMPKTHALLALLLLQTARFSARLNAAGEILLLPEQDRTTWNHAMITRGMLHLERARAGDTISEFHLQAGIAACHCSAETYEATDWPKILFFYDLLLELNDSPVIALNRAVVISKVRGPDAGLAAIDEIQNRNALKNYYLCYAVLGELHLASGHHQQAGENFSHALRLTSIPAEEHFLRRRLDSLAS